MKMTRRSGYLLAFAAIALSVVLTGCSGVKHSGPSYIQAGQPYPVQVTASPKKDQQVSGDVFYRPGGESQYQQMPLIVRNGGRNLSASLPVELSVAGQAIEYYIDVMKGDKQHGFYSPATPRRVEVLDRESFVARQLHVKVAFGYQGEPVKFFLATGGVDVYDPILKYQAPGISGWVTAPMTPGRNGRWFVVVPGDHVQAGWWNYRVDTLVDGVAYGIPAQDWESFEVKYPRVESHPPSGHGDHSKGRVSRHEYR